MTYSLQTISGWGRTKSVKSQVFEPKDLNDLIEFVKNSEGGSIISRGLGRSYGDSAQLKNKTVIKLSNNYFKK